MGPPLVGVRVLDLSGEHGAYGTRLLADLGAEVVKVEQPGGDVQRRRPPFADGAFQSQESLTFAYYNAGKRDVVVDFGSPSAAAQLALLAEGVDVVVMTSTATSRVPGWPPASARPIWLGPRPILCVLSDFGHGGPDDELRSTHLTSFARSGQMWASGDPDGPPLAIPGRPFYDEMSAHAAALVMAALRGRDQGGPRTIELSVHDLLAWRETVAFTLQAAAGIEPAQRGSTMSGAPPSGVWATSDGFVELMVYNPPHWDGFVRLVGEPGELSDPALRIRSVRTERAGELAPLVGALLATRTTADIVEHAQAHRIPCAPLNSPLDVTRDPQLIARGFWIEQPRAKGAPLVVPGRPFRVEPDLWAPHRQAPDIGQDNEALLPVMATATALETAPGEWPEQVPPPRATGGMLHGIRVLTFGTAIAGNVSSSLLAELGADVVKIEAPGRPDPLRAGPINPDLDRVFEPRAAVPVGAGSTVLETEPVETNFMFAGYSRSGRSLALNMKDGADRATFLALLARADVLIDNFATGVMASWGLPPEILRDTNPSLIMVSVSGFGRTGPAAHYMAYGANINSFLGLTRIWAPHGTQFDYSAVANVLVAVMAGLTHRDSAGEGVSVDLAQIEAGVAVLAPLYLESLANGSDSRPEANDVPGAWLSGVFRAAGVDSWVAVELEDVADALRVLAVLQPEDYTTPGDLEAAQVKSQLEQWICARTPEQAEHDLRRAGLAAAAVRRIADLYQDAQLWARHQVLEVLHPDLGPMVLPASFVRLDGSALPIRRPSARLGEHTDEVLGEWLASVAALAPH